MGFQSASELKVHLRSRALAATLLLFAALIYLFAWSPIFSVKSIEAAGLPREISSETIISKSEISIGEKLARIDPRAIEKNLSELSWIKEVSVDRSWLHGKVTITVTSRTPLGIFHDKVLDASGTLFDLPGKVPSGLPVVTASTPELGLEAIGLFTSLPVDLRNSLISISAANPSSISSWQQRGESKIKVMWGSNKDIALKVSVFRALLALPENKAIKRVDLSAPHAPIVK
jgi:cell division protein FtsQ